MFLLPISSKFFLSLLILKNAHVKFTLFNIFKDQCNQEFSSYNPFAPFKKVTNCFTDWLYHLQSREQSVSDPISLCSHQYLSLSKTKF